MPNLETINQRINPMSQTVNNSTRALAQTAAQKGTLNTMVIVPEKFSALGAVK